MTTRARHFGLAALLLFPGCTRQPLSPWAVPRDPAGIMQDMAEVLDTELGRWYPLCVDTVYGGFFSDVNARWELEGKQDKMIVTQARHVWAASRAAMYDPKYRRLLGVAAHGERFLAATMWDTACGGLYEMVTRTGEVIPDHGEVIKTAYGNAFAIYGLAACYRATGDTGALRLAQAGFRWLDAHSRDPVGGGYFQFLSRRGEPYADGWRGTPPKDQNSSIHLLESFTELYAVWPDTTLRERLSSLLALVRDRITNRDGYMNLFFRRDWTPVTYSDSGAAARAEHYDIDHVSFGHDVETAYLMLEAASALGAERDSATAAVAKRKVDVALRYGWDAERGGIFDGGFADREGRVRVVRTTKEWWAQAEALNTLLLMSRTYPADTVDYYGKFCAQWAFCVRYAIDRERGGWYWDALDTSPA
ncbi:MAG TPA: AGE family epimerase/isomerase, partial [Bacteroidota bacterium]|nr:AGE family epimerase/isomerase [Bacteroidota bacterium]